LMGFGGLDITPKGIIQHKTILPKHWNSLVITGVGKDKSTVTVRK
jgi:protein-glucosylgalactosylhydroxylysine glucosidase